LTIEHVLSKSGNRDLYFVFVAVCYSIASVVWLILN